MGEAQAGVESYGNFQQPLAIKHTETIGSVFRAASHFCQLRNGYPPTPRNISHLNSELRLSMVSFLLFVTRSLLKLLIAALNDLGSAMPEMEDAKHTTRSALRMSSFNATLVPASTNAIAKNPLRRLPGSNAHRNESANPPQLDSNWFGIISG